MFKCKYLFLLVFLSIAIQTGYTVENNLSYRSRGNRFEGIREFPVSSATIELRSFKATDNRHLSADTIPPTYRLRFFLENNATPYVVVRDLEDRYSYYLDQVTPLKPWRPGFNNLFEWSTKDVINNIHGLDLDHLGVIIRLESDHPSDREKVAPAVLYQSLSPTAITGYDIVFKTNVTAKLKFTIRKNNGSTVETGLDPQIVQKWKPEIPLHVTWNAANAGAGKYRLVVEGLNLKNDEPFGQEISFFHNPVVQ